MISINHLPVQAAALIPTLIYKENVVTPLNESTFNDYGVTKVNDETQGNHEMMPNSHSEETVPGNIATPTPPNSQLEVSSQLAELVVIDLQQMEMESAAIVVQDNISTDEL